MRTSRFLTALFFFSLVFGVGRQTALAADPGEALATFSEASTVSDQRPGSVLFYNVYTSNATAPATENTRLSITNTGPREVAVHLFFIDGASCSPADAMVCLTANQTATFLASNFDPGTVGYLVAIAVDRSTGWPIRYNYLIGDEYVKFASGHEASLGAEAVLARTPAAANNVDSQVTLNFDGVEYDRLPSVVAIDNLASRVDGNDTLVIINRPSGNLATGADPLGVLFGLLYNDAETPASFQINSSQCQFRFSFSNAVPRTSPRFTNFVPGGRSGWARFFNLAGTAPLIGAAINYNPAATASSTAFNQGHNFHVMKLVPSSSIVIPVFPPNC